MSTHRVSDDRVGVRRASATRVTPVQVAATLGAVLLAFEVYLLVNWFTGPDFKRVPVGPSTPTTFMKVSIDVYQPLGILVVLGMIYVMIVRPWREERAVKLYGLLIPVLALSSIYDPVGSYFHDWYGYNSYWVNFGSPLPHGVPGWEGFAQPGAMIAWPVIFTPVTYVIFFSLLAWIGGKLMTATSRRWPALPKSALLFEGFVLMLVLDFLMEGTVFMRLGWYAESGASLNSGHAYQMPWINMVLASILWAALAGFCCFRDDSGYTVAERGVGRYPATSAKAITLRFLAVLAAFQIILLGTYQIPMAIFQDHDRSHWPASIASKSYFTDSVCGPGTPRRCP